MPLIDIQKLRKVFGPIVAVDDVSFSVERGEVVGFLGPNGAGKSTTMKMLCCFLPPDGGTATIAGNDILSDPVGVRQSLGYVAENVPLYNEMTTAGFLNFVCDIRRIAGGDRKKAIERVIDSCALDGVFHQQIGTLSKGFRRRVGLAQALIHDPEVLILDEPTDGLDPNQKHEVRELIKEMAPGKGIVISTHILEEVDAICSRIIIIDRGRLRVDGTPGEVREQGGGSLEQLFRNLTTSDAPGTGGDHE